MELDVSKPLGSQPHSVVDDDVRGKAEAFRERHDVDHKFDKSGSIVRTVANGGGKHSQITFFAPRAKPETMGTSEGMVYIKDVDGKAELHFCDEDLHEKQLTKAGIFLITKADLDPTINTDYMEVHVDDGLGLKDNAVPRKKMKDNYVLIVDEKTSGTHGGGSTADSWETRDLNTEKHDDGNLASLASNQVTLAAGTYRFRISVPANAVNGHMARLYNVTDTAVVAYGSSERASTGATYGTTHSVIVGQFTTDGSKAYRVEHRCQLAHYQGFGYPVAIAGVNETYTMAEFWQVK